MFPRVDISLAFGKGQRRDALAISQNNISHLPSGQGTREKSRRVRSPRLGRHFRRELAVHSASAGLDARLPYLWPQP